jgi:phage tail protein X
MIAVARAGETIDALCFRQLGRTAGVTEQTLALNPGMAARGNKLAQGEQVNLPDIAAAAIARRETVQLWDI